jgi:hypothetical protein
MAESTGPGNESSAAAHLLASAVRLKEAAVRAGRLDVAAKADEALALIAIEAREQPPARGDAANAVLKILDGLGL